MSPVEVTSGYKPQLYNCNQTQMQKKPSSEMLEKYFNGECNDNEIAEINAWYASFEHGGGEISGLRGDERETLRMQMWRNIRRGISSTQKDKRDYLDEGKRNFSLLYYAGGIAAAILIAIFIYLQQSVPSVTTEKTNIVAVNKSKMIQEINLSDGSKVWLSPNSQLTYSKSFEKNSRKVYLSGEAFFEVTKNPQRPFLIFSGNVTTKVWGTSFRIRAFKNEIIKVDVVTGKVSVSIPEKATHSAQAVKSEPIHMVMLTPDQEAAYDPREDNLIKNVKADPLIRMWKKTSISFDNTPMRKVFLTLNQKFNVNIRSDDQEINADYLNADFSNESLPAIMEMMKTTFQ